MRLINLIGKIYSYAFHLFSQKQHAPLNLKTTLLEQEAFDTSTLTMFEAINWRREKFLARTPLPLLSVEERNDIEAKYTDKLPTIQNSIEQSLDQSGIALTVDEKRNIIEKASQQYLLTLQYYSPAVVQWIDVILQQAALSDKKVVFLARDGIVFHTVAKILIEKDPNRYNSLSPDKLSVAWLSRKSAKDASERGDLLQRYFKQLGIEENEDVMIVDTGCTGSMKPQIAPHLKNWLEWQFSVSRNPAINGFWDHADFSLQALAFTILPPDHPDSWANDPKSANNWIEDTHRGNFISAETLIDDQEHGIIYPTPSMELVEQEGQYQLVTKESIPNDVPQLLSFLIRDLGYKAIVDFANEVSLDSYINYDETKRNLNDLLTRIQKNEISIPCLHD